MLTLQSQGPSGYEEVAHPSPVMASTYTVLQDIAEVPFPWGQVNAPSYQLGEKPPQGFWSNVEVLQRAEKVSPLATAATAPGREWVH